MAYEETYIVHEYKCTVYEEYELEYTSGRFAFMV
jgi:hypothetical protein